MFRTALAFTRRPIRDSWGVAAALVAAAALYLRAHAGSPIRPLAAEQGNGWWGWYDQFHYLRSALAWAQGDLNPAHHWYWAGYPLLGAPFAGLTPAQPFLIPDLLCLLASTWLCARLARHILPAGLPARGSLGAAVFVATTLLHPRLRDVWVVPWNTTASTPAVLACLLAAAAFTRRPGWRAAALGGLSLAATGLVRPTDMAGPLAAWAVVGLWAIASRALPGRTLARALAAGLAGAALPAAVAVAAHVAVFGWQPSQYMRESALTGFEPALLPFRWATIVLNARMVFPEGDGLAQIFPWFLPGIGGILVCALLARGGGRAAHAAIGAAVAVHVLLYLGYRDMHAPGLWRYHNFHYDKPVLPLLSLYAVALLALVPTTAARRRAWLAAALLVAALMPWRGVERPAAGAPVELVDAQTLRLPGGLPHAGDGVRIAATGVWEAIYFNEASLTIGDAVFRHHQAFKLFPDNGTLLLVALRDLPPGEAVLHLDRAVTLRAEPPPRRVALGTRLAAPCLLRGICPRPEPWSGKE